MSIEYPETLYRRAREYLESARVNLVAGRYDVAAVESEIAAQLALKALIALRGFEPPRTHRVRRLMSFIIGLGALPEDRLRELQEYARRRRNELIILERAREAGQYGGSPVDREEAEVAYMAASEVVGLVERLWRLCEES